MGKLTPEENKVFQETANTEGGWEKLWQKGMTPWDFEQVAPGLVELFTDGSVPSGDNESQRALVPGCGGGYDVPFFASKGYKTLGVDLSETAIAKANKKLESDNKEAQALCAFKAGDFFTMDLGGQFDVVYDYTFLCALHPTLRTKWAARMADLVKPNAFLIALMFPLAEYPDGPPYSMTTELYEELLSDKFEKVFMRDCPTFPARAGREKMSLWRRKA